ncbi:hypothetical protein HDU76_007096 [Blyttiomyces sp. JEL0837]|nr:hypothetical protein HDU76_007096 [Blyttiomyces sp. JEL0837]
MSGRVSITANIDRGNGGNTSNNNKTGDLDDWDELIDDNQRTLTFGTSLNRDVTSFTLKHTPSMGTVIGISTLDSNPSLSTRVSVAVNGTVALTASSLPAALPLPPPPPQPLISQSSMVGNSNNIATSSNTSSPVMQPQHSVIITPTSQQTSVISQPQSQQSSIPPLQITQTSVIITAQTTPVTTTTPTPRKSRQKRRVRLVGDEIKVTGDDPLEDPIDLYEARQRIRSEVDSNWLESVTGQVSQWELGSNDDDLNAALTTRYEKEDLEDDLQFKSRLVSLSELQREREKAREEEKMMRKLARKRERERVEAAARLQREREDAERAANERRRLREEEERIANEEREREARELAAANNENDGNDGNGFDVAGDERRDSSDAVHEMGRRRKGGKGGKSGKKLSDKDRSGSIMGGGGDMDGDYGRSMSTTTKGLVPGGLGVNDKRRSISVSQAQPRPTSSQNRGPRASLTVASPSKSARRNSVNLQK